MTEDGALPGSTPGEGSGVEVIVSGRRMFAVGGGGMFVRVGRKRVLPLLLPD